MYLGTNFFLKSKKPMTLWEIRESESCETELIFQTLDWYNTDITNLIYQGVF